MCAADVEVVQFVVVMVVLVDPPGVWEFTIVLMCFGRYVDLAVGLREIEKINHYMIFLNP